MTALNPTVSGTVSSYLVSPALPAGISIDANGTISGTPTVATVATEYRVTASNSAGSTSFVLRLTVIRPPVGFAYAGPVTLPLNVAIAPLRPTVTGTVDTFTAVPALPAGLILDAATGVIGGTPTQLTAQTHYTISATNIAGSATFQLGISVQLARSTVDSPDGAAPVNQVHVIYAVPLGGTDWQLDVDGTLERSVRSANAWMVSISTGGQRVRVDERSDGSLDVSFYQLANDDAFYASRGSQALVAMAAEIQATPLYNPNKIYFIFYEGSNNAVCGGGRMPGHFSALYLHGTPPGALPCDTTPFAAAPTAAAARYREWGFVHEIVHNLGFVNSCAPHHSSFSPGHTGDEPSDVMWGYASAGDTRRWLPNTLDPGNDDYYGANVPAACPRNLFNSAFLEPTQGTQLPVGF